MRGSGGGGAPRELKEHGTWVGMLGVGEGQNLSGQQLLSRASEPSTQAPYACFSCGGRRHEPEALKC